MRVFSKKMLGANYEKARKNILVCLFVFCSLEMAEFHIVIAPFVLYLMSSMVTAGAAWQAFSSTSNMEEMRHVLMLPTCNWKLSLSYAMSVGIYAIVTVSSPLLAVVFAVADCRGMEIVTSLFCVINAVFMSACIYVYRKYRWLGVLWIGLLLIVTYIGNQWNMFWLVILVNAVVAVGLLSVANVYDFIEKGNEKSGVNHGGNHHSIWRYILRYLMSHKNYIVNTFAMWGVAVLLPMLLGELGSTFVLPIGFAILTLNTPICILLSCDPSLEQAVRSMPRQMRRFILPYGFFILLCNSIADLIFLISWRVQIGAVSPLLVGIAFGFALLSAIGSVLLEWFCPLRNWKIESDLWHHPRKYVVPGIMMLLAGVVGVLLC